MCVRMQREKYSYDKTKYVVEVIDPNSVTAVNHTGGI